MEQQPSLDGYGKKTCYIRIIKELWGAKGYGDLGLSSQNLRDQAAGLEKTQRAGEQGKFTMRCTDGGRGKFKIYAGGNLSREELFGENSEGFTTLSINADLFHLEEETESQYGNLITTSSQDLLREGRITQGRIGKLKASGPSDRS